MAKASESKLPFPQGIEASHAASKAWYSFATPLGVGGIALFLAAALDGAFGGQPHPIRTIETANATLTVEFPEILRNGEFFEMRATAKAKRPIEDLRIGISASYWRDLTINTMFPAPSEEKAENGRFEFSYGAVKAGDTITIKIDGQINPPMFAGTKGTLTLSDGDTELTSVALKLRVYP